VRSRWPLLIVVLLIVLPLVPAPSSAQQRTTPNPVQFAAPIVYRNPIPYASGIASGDLTNNGIPDLVVVSPDDGLVEVRLGKGEGTFGHWLYSLAGNSPSVVALGKFDGKNLDAVINDIYDAWVLLGGGKGGFPRATFLDAGGNFVTSFAVGDFNGDGKQDIAALADISTQNSDSSMVYLYLGNGDGTFQSPRQLPVSPLGPVAILAGDFNGDGKLDLAVLSVYLHNHVGRVSVLLGNGHGGFESPLIYHLSKLFDLPSMASGDFNRDEKLDLAVAYSNYGSNESSFVRILLGNGNGTFRKGARALGGPNPLSVASADFNGDGIPDLVVANSPCYPACSYKSSISVLLGNGDGTFQPPARFRVHGQTALQLTVADFNGDGKPDVATVNGNSQNVSVLLNTTPFPAPKTKPARSQQH
jgi:FG-GAP-like repeat